ncbi:MAG: BatD family protein [Halieaceae bacterium]
MLLLLYCSVFTQAMDLQTLVENDRLRLVSWLTPADNIVVGQEVQLVIEVSTPRWFAGGTRIRPPEVNNLVILRRNDFAVNSSRREAEATWVVQQWQLELYPQRAGDYQIPPVQLELAVNDADAGIVRGTLQTLPLSISAGIPELLENAEGWLATSSLAVEQRLDRQTAGLRPGDALRREITLRATQVTAMMLPEVSITQIQGLPAYPENPELEDRSNRGEATALRRQVITYVVEQAGQYQIPEQLFLWWDTTSNSVKTTILPALSIDAGVATPSAASASQTLTLELAWPWLAGTAAALVLVLVIIVLWRWLRRPRPGSERQLLKQAARALRRGNKQLAVSRLYQWLNRQQAQGDWLSLRAMADDASDAELDQELESLLRDVYAGAGRASSGQRASSEQRASSARGNLAQRLARKRKTSIRQGLLRTSAELPLNPSDQPR